MDPHRQQVREPSSGGRTRRTVEAHAGIGNRGNFVGGVGPYSSELEPAFMPPEYIELLPRNEVYQVEAVAPIPALDVTLNATANGTNANQEATDLEMDDDMLGQFRIVDPADVRDGVSIQVDQGGRESMLYSTKNSRGEIQTNTGDLVGESALTELFQHETRDLHFTVVESNGDGSDVTLTFAGYAYHLSPELQRGQLPSEVLPWPVTVGPISKVEK